MGKKEIPTQVTAEVIKTAVKQTLHESRTTNESQTSKGDTMEMRFPRKIIG